MSQKLQNRRKNILVANFRHRIIWCDGINQEINRDTMTQFQMLLARMNAQNQREIKFFIRGIGGDFHSTNDIISAIRLSKSPIDLIIFGFVASASLMLSQAPFRTKRALSGAKFIFHKARHRPSENFLTDVAVMDEDFYVSQLRELAFINATQVFYYTASGAPTGIIYNLLDAQVTIGNGQARRLGFIDGIISRKEFQKYTRLMGKRFNKRFFVLSR